MEIGVFCRSVSRFFRGDDDLSEPLRPRPSAGAGPSSAEPLSACAGLTAWMAQIAVPARTDMRKPRLKSTFVTILIPRKWRHYWNDCILPFITVV